MNLSPDRSTLWMGNLDRSMDEKMISKGWAYYGYNVKVKMVPDVVNALPNSGYCFVKFSSAEIAKQVFDNLNHVKTPFLKLGFELNWAAGCGVDLEGEYKMPEFSIFVGNLSYDATDSLLFTYFKNRYPSVRGVKIVKSGFCNDSRYGFIRFGDELEQFMSLLEINGSLFLGRPLIAKEAGPKHVQMISSSNKLNTSRTCVFIGNLSSITTPQVILRAFMRFGPVADIKILPAKRCGFVQFENKASANAALNAMNDSVIGGNRVRLSWGKI